MSASRRPGAPGLSLGGALAQNGRPGALRRRDAARHGAVACRGRIWGEIHGFFHGENGGFDGANHLEIIWKSSGNADFLLESDE